MPAANASSLGFPLKGSLRRNPIAKLMRLIARSEGSGNLYLVHDQTKKVVHFEGGQPRSVRSNVLSECLGQILTREGLISQEQCNQTLEAIRRTGKKQGELLIEMGIISEGNLRYGLEAQFREKLFDAFQWDDGRYQFKTDAESPDPGINFELSSASLIFEALLTHASQEKIERALESVLERYLVAPEGVAENERLDLHPQEAHYLTGLDGSRNLKELLEEDVGFDFPHRKKFVYALIQSGIAKLSKKQRSPREALPAPESGLEKEDSELLPGYATSARLTDFEDTPLPGQLPIQPDGAVTPKSESEFEGVAEDSQVTALPTANLSEALANAEAQTEDFGDDFELLDDDELELIEDDDDDEPTLSPAPAELEAAQENPIDIEALADDLKADDDLSLGGEGFDLSSLGSGIALSEEEEEDKRPSQAEEASEEEAADSLVSMDELDDVDLSGLDELQASSPAPASYVDTESTMPDNPALSADFIGAQAFADGELALSAQEWETAIDCFESAYENNVDVAELHAMLAYARFMANPGQAEMTEHALELLAYAEQLNPQLDLVWSYRAVVYEANGAIDDAREAVQQALSLNAYNDLALAISDRL